MERKRTLAKLMATACAVLPGCSTHTSEVRFGDCRMSAETYDLLVKRPDSHPTYEEFDKFCNSFDDGNHYLSKKEAEEGLEALESSKYIIGQ